MFIVLKKVQSQERDCIRILSTFTKGSNKIEMKKITDKYLASTIKDIESKSQTHHALYAKNLIAIIKELQELRKFKKGIDRGFGGRP